MHYFKQQRLLKIFYTVFLQEKSIFLCGLATLLIYSSQNFFGSLISTKATIFTTVGLFLIILYAAYNVVRHAEIICYFLKPPLGSLVLTLSVATIEITLVASVMLTGQDVPTLARDSIYAIFMFAVNGITGLALLIGSWRYKEQMVNLRGSRTYLSVIIFLGVIALIFPNYTTSTIGPTFSTFFSIFLVIIAASLYIVFFVMQTKKYRSYFIEINGTKNNDSISYTQNKQYSLIIHGIFLVAYLIFLGILNHAISAPLEQLMIKYHLPTDVTGLLVAVLVLAPEATTAIRAAFRNHIQEAVNLSLGSACATICLTIPAVLAIGMYSGKNIILGLNQVDSLLLMLTLLISIVTFGHVKTNILQGMIHLLLFFTYILLVFD